jgi:hypothetical protein
VASTEVLRDITNQARHVYAVSTRLMTASFTAGHVSEDAARVVHVELRAAAETMHDLQQQWGTVTTATRPGHEYVTATTTLHTSLTALERELSPDNHVDVAHRIDTDQALADLRYAATDLAKLTHAAAQVPEPLLRSGLLFAPARILPSTMERLQDRNHGRYVAIQLEEGAELIDAAREGSSAARRSQETLETAARPAATTELLMQTLAEGYSRRKLEPATSPGGPDLF